MSEYDEYDFNDEELAALRRKSERVALEKALVMLESDATPATARASVIRTLLGDASQRRHDDEAADLEPHQMTAAQLDKAARSAILKLEVLQAAAGRKKAEDVEYEVLPPVDDDVFG